MNGILFVSEFINHKIMENLEIATIALIKSLDLELKAILLADLEVVRTKQAA